MPSQTVTESQPELIAHRGYAARFPENTLPALEAAISAGARYVEFDVQMTADAVPVLLHDATLTRTAGIEASIQDLSWADARQVSVHEPARFGDAFKGVQLPALAQAAELLARHPAVTAFVELKGASLARFGAEVVADRALAELTSLLDHIVIISFHPEALAAARQRGAERIGLCIERYDDTDRAHARALHPWIVFADLTALPNDGNPLWPEPWHWAVYEVETAEVARALHARGARYIETMAYVELRDALHSRR